MEYREAVPLPVVVELTVPTPDAPTDPATYTAGQWLQVLAQLGEAGWGLVCSTPAPDGACAFRIKRPID